MTSVSPCRKLVTTPSPFSARLVAKPNSRENTISGSIALLESSPTKSFAVKKFTIMSLVLAYSPISSASMFSQGVSTGGNIFMSTNMITAAIAPVTTKVTTVVPSILPALFFDFMPAMDPAMDANTKGTTIQNIMLIKTFPRGLMAAANPGATHPATQPRIIAPISIARKR